MQLAIEMQQTIDDLTRRHNRALNKIDVLEYEIEELQNEIMKFEKALDVYQRERERFRHAKMEKAQDQSETD